VQQLVVADARVLLTVLFSSSPNDVD